MERSKPKLLIIGCTSFVGSWVTMKAIDTNSYHVIGAIKKGSKEEKIEILKAGFGDKFAKIEIVELDVLEPETLDEAIKGCKFVIDMATPFILETPKDPVTFINNWVQGTINVLESCKKNGVKRLVFTSALATIEDFTMGDCEIDETHFAGFADHTLAYIKSKILAEKEVWSFINSQKEEDKLETVIINPGFWVGPLILKSETVSQKVVTGLLDGSLNSFPNVYTFAVDVRNCAEAHIKGLTWEPNHRFAMTEGTYTFNQIADYLAEEFNTKGFKVSCSSPPSALLWTLKFFIKDVDYFYNRLGVKCHIKNDKAKEKLNIDFTPLKTALVDMGNSLIEHKYVQAKTSSWWCF